MGKSEIIDSYDNIIDTLIGRIAELQDELDRLEVIQRVKSNPRIKAKKKVA